MTTRTELLDALTLDPEGLTFDALLERCPAADGDRQIVGGRIAALAAEGLVRMIGMRDGAAVYALAVTPAERPTSALSEREASTPPRRPAGAGQVAQDTTPRAVTRAPQASPAPAPIAPAPPPEIRMTTADKILALYEQHGMMSTRQLRKHIKVANLSTLCSILVRKHRLVKVGGGPRSSVYALAARTVPEKPPEPTPRAPKPAPKSAPSALPVPAALRVPAAPINGTRAKFAIDADGNLALNRAEGGISLDPTEFATLRAFIERTTAVWTGDQK